MKVVFRSKDFNSVMAGGLGFNNRRPMASWHYQGRVQHMNWQGTFECHWDEAEDGSETREAQQAIRRNTPEIIWTVSGDARLFGLAAALKSKGFPVEVLQDENV